MARPREFDPDAAITRAVDVFWAHGYEGTSLPQLLEGMQISRGSLYKAFATKKAVFLQALKAYDRSVVAPAVAILSNEAGPPGAERIARLFESVASDVRRGDRRGCLLCNAVAGPAAVDEDIRRLSEAMLNRLVTALVAALTDADRASGAPAETRAQRAESLLANYIGLRVMARAGRSPADLDNAIRGVLSRDPG